MTADHAATRTTSDPGARPRPSDVVPVAPAIPYSGRYDLDRAEIWADGIVHALGILLGVAGLCALLGMGGGATGGLELGSLAIYGGSLVLALTVSAIYNLWPISPAKWVLRRIDHSAIYVLIGGTYTPFLLGRGPSATALLAVIWALCLAGITLKLRWPGRFDRLAILLYLLLGWSGLLAYDHLLSLPPVSLTLLAVGGLVYTVGVVFHVWESLRFQTAIWHGFVLVAAACHYGAVLGGVVLSGQAA